MVDIQTILNGPARFCQHCEVVILSDIITKQKWELPVLRQPEQLADQLHFCSSACLAQFSSSQLTPAAAAERRAAAVVDHTGRHGLSAAADVRRAHHRAVSTAGADLGGVLDLCANG